MHCDILTIFPSMFAPVLNQGILQKAQDKNLFSYKTHDLRSFANNKHKQVDDVAYGGGPGMVLKPEPIFTAIESLNATKSSLILMSPQGKRLDQPLAKNLAKRQNLFIICGRYEGVDERVVENLPVEEISLGDYVLNGGELPAMVLIESVVRLIPGVLGDEQSAQEDSFFNGLLDHPHYTRPADFKGMKVPDVLCSGHHEDIRKFRRYQSLKRTWHRRPDLLEKIKLTPEDEKFLDEIKQNCTK